MREAYGNADVGGLFYTGQGNMLACNFVALMAARFGSARS